MVEMPQLPIRAIRLLIPSPLPLLVLERGISQNHDCDGFLNQSLTSILLFSLLAASKSPSLIPFETHLQRRLLSHSFISSKPSYNVVTSSFGVVTSVKVSPVLLSLLVKCHKPSSVCLAVVEGVGRAAVCSGDGGYT